MEQKNNTKTIISNVIAISLYVVAAVCLYYAYTYYNCDVKLFSVSDQYMFFEEEYVGGDAYNYIVTAARSSAVMTKSLIWVVLGCASAILARLIQK